MRYLQHATDSAGNEGSIWTERCRCHAVRERNVMKQHSALPVDKQRLSVLINSEQHNAVRTHTEGRQLSKVRHTCYHVYALQAVYSITANSVDCCTCLRASFGRVELVLCVKSTCSTARQWKISQLQSVC